MERIIVEPKAVVLSPELKFCAVACLTNSKLSECFGQCGLIFIFDRVDSCLLWAPGNWLRGLSMEDKIWTNTVRLLSAKGIGW